MSLPNMRRFFMQIDFHHAVTYVTSRLAGFSINESEIISYSAQYVDDAINSGTIKFRNRAMYSRDSSAHKMLDYRNFEELANHLAWVPFHFLPGNDCKKAGDNTHESFIEKLVCTPDSFVAEEMVRSCIADKQKEYGLHRLGITLHVLADTYAHQGFAGINHKINDVESLKTEKEKENTLKDKVADFFGDLFDKVKGKFVSDVLPLGHGGALTCPDIPYLKWSYKNYKGESITRDNTSVFMDAVKKMHEIMIRFRKDDPDYQLMDSEQMNEADLKKIESNFLNFKYEEGEERQQKWIESIANGDFSFSDGSEEIIKYIPKGYGSWKYIALDTRKETETKNEKFKFNTEFLHSDWKMFHDAVQIHRIEVIRNILPEYGICVA